MKIQKTKKASTVTLLPEDMYAATVNSVVVKTKDGTQEPLNVEVSFALTGVVEPITRSYPAKIEGRSPLLQDAKTILGRPLTREEEAEGFDPSILAGCRCRVVVAHRVDGSGRLAAQAKLVLAPEVTPAVAAA